MKKSGFTLIELLIVTVVIVTLMGIVFRLAGTGSDQKARAMTIERMQRIENALSGYYAAYGSYPPVPLQGRSQSIYTAVAANGVQRGDVSGQINLQDANKAGSQVARQIEAACRAQPVAALYPLNNKMWEGALSELGDGFRLLDNYGNPSFDKTDWKECELFQFGLLSFLLPRYMFMLEGDHELYDRWGSGQAQGRRVGQWNANNRIPCLIDGTRPESWEEIQKWMGMGEYWTENGGGGNVDKATMVSNIASQAVCARWMPNFKGIISGGGVFFNIDTRWYDHDYLLKGVGANPNFPEVKRFSPNGGEDGDSAAEGGGDSYVLDGMTIYDGWGHEFYYYSAPPYQSYRIWSAGANGLTFPPWLDLPTNKKELDAVKSCIDDDIVHMSN